MIKIEAKLVIKFKIIMIKMEVESMIKMKFKSMIKIKVKSMTKLVINLEVKSSRPPVDPEVPPLDAEVGLSSLQPGPRPLPHLHHNMRGTFSQLIGRCFLHVNVTRM